MQKDLKLIAFYRCDGNNKVYTLVKEYFPTNECNCTYILCEGFSKNGPYKQSNSFDGLYDAVLWLHSNKYFEIGA